VLYRQVDLEDADAVSRLVDDIVSSHGRLDGIVHAAGMLADAYIPNKTAATVNAVLAPKVTGTYHLHCATERLPLQFFVLMSSIAAPLGNPGQSDYAAANGFMDWFAAYRDAEAAAGRCFGRTRSINWGLWQDGGMRLDGASATI
jgi:polyketide synthase PksN